MDIVERLRGHAKGNAGGVRELLVLSADEIERLRQQNAELVDALRMMLENDENLTKPLEELFKGFCIKARAAIAKATGGE